jgi:hypothetical protein
MLAKFSNTFRCNECLLRIYDQIFRHLLGPPRGKVTKVVRMTKNLTGLAVSVINSRMSWASYSKRRMHSIACAPLCPQHIMVSGIINVLSKVASAINGSQSIDAEG